MADAAEVAIESALINRLVALTFSPSIPVSLPNVDFTPPTAGAKGYGGVNDLKKITTSIEVEPDSIVTVAAA